jgi:DNA-directed RNA polymerase subunit RPC12/RpoP
MKPGSAGGRATALKYSHLQYCCVTCGEDVPESEVILELSHCRRCGSCGPVVWQKRPTNTREVVLRRLHHITERGKNA